MHLCHLWFWYIIAKKPTRCIGDEYANICVPNFPHKHCFTVAHQHVLLQRSLWSWTSLWRIHGRKEITDNKIKYRINLIIICIVCVSERMRRSLVIITVLVRLLERSNGGSISEGRSHLDTFDCVDLICRLSSHCPVRLVQSSTNKNSIPTTEMSGCSIFH